MGQHATLSSRDIIGTFYENYENAMAMGLCKRIAMYFESDKESESYKWLGTSPAMREWVAERLINGLRENGFTITNKIFEATLGVLVDDVRRDKTGQIMMRVGQLADRAAEHPDSLLATLINNAGALVCYDGQYFFDTDHSEGNSGTQSNIVTADISDIGHTPGGSATAPSEKTMASAIFKGITRMLGFKDDQGQPANGGAKKFLVHVPIGMADSAIGAVTKQVFANGENNTLLNTKMKFELDVEPDPRLTYTDKFNIYRLDGRMMPFIEQEEVPTQMEAIAEGSEHEFKNREWLFGVHAIRNVGLGDWKKAVQVVFQA